MKLSSRLNVLKRESGGADDGVSDWRVTQLIGSRLLELEGWGQNTERLVE